MQRVKIILRRPNQKDLSMDLRKGLGLQAAEAKYKGSIDFDCRQADCGVCIIKILEGAENLSEKTFEEKDFLKAMNADSNERLACQCRVLGDVSIEVEF